LYGNSFGILSGGSPKLSTWDLLLSTGFYFRLCARLFFYHLTPLGVVGVLAALLLKAFSREQRTITSGSGSWWRRFS
jgi:hypothetical protein